MRGSTRGLVALALLAGFYVIALSIIAVLAAVDIVAVAHHRLVEIKLVVATVPVIFVVAGALVTALRPIPDPRAGVLVTRDGQPRLVRFVTSLAERVGVRAPDEIRLVPDMNAAVSERGGMLGLRRGSRVMYIGVPMLAGLSEPQLAAVLAHELGHYSNQDTRLSGTTYRGRVALLHIIGRLNSKRWLQRMVEKIIIQYAKLYFRVSYGVCRRQELAADAMSARIAGTAAACSALREAPALAAAWGFFLDEYVTIGRAFNLLPGQIASGFRALLAEPTRQAELDQIRHAPPDGDGSAYDTHPPIAQRIAAIEGAQRGSGERPARPARGTHPSERPAIALLADADAVCDHVIRDALAIDGPEPVSVGWAELVHRARRAEALASARPLLESAARLGTPPGSLATVLDLLDRGLLDQLGEPLAESLEGIGRRAQREVIRTAVLQSLSDLVAVALADAGKARWTLSWSAPAALTIGEPYAQALPDALRAATADGGGTARLRSLLAHAGVDRRMRAATAPAPAGRRPRTPHG